MGSHKLKCSHALFDIYLSFLQCWLPLSVLCNSMTVCGLYACTCSVMLLLGQDLSHMFEGDLLPKGHSMVYMGSHKIKIVDHMLSMVSFTKKKGHL